METEFNLLDEKWICVRRQDCTVEKLSLTDTLLHAHEYVGLAGELPTQDVAILRLLLAVLQTVFIYYAPDGTEEKLNDPDDVLDRWETLWKAGVFPEAPIRKYLNKWYDRFWLFHPERPFYQSVETMDEKTAAEFQAAKLNSSISESNNKIRLFSSRTGEEKARLSYAEAARWLIHIQAFDDGSNERGKGVKAIGVGWLGNLGIIVARGNNLFEDLMLNMIGLDNNWDTWEEEIPIWEQKPCSEPRREVQHPNSLSELYTLQSRRIALLPKNGFVTGCKICGGDYYEKDTYAFIEPMTLWKMDGKGSSIKEKKRIPKTHNISCQMWREFSTCFPHDDDKTRPGIVAWIGYLRSMGLIDKSKYICFMICSVKYDTMKSCYEDIFSDSLTFHTDLLTELGTNWQTYITEEVANCDKLAKAMRQLAKKLELAKGSSLEKAEKCTAVESAEKQFYYEIDVPFRQWLASIDPGRVEDSEEKDNVIQAWRNTAKGIALKLGEELVNASGPAAFVGRTVEENKKEDKKSSKKEKKKETTNEDSKCVYYCAPMAFQEFENEVKYGIYKGGVR